MPSNSNSKRFLTVAEYAQVTGDSESTIRREIRAGKLRFRQSDPRKKIKIPIEALDLRSENDSTSAREQIKKVENAHHQLEKISGPNPDWLD